MNTSKPALPEPEDGIGNSTWLVHHPTRFGTVEVMTVAAARAAIESQAAQIAALTAERDALRADANRYRAAKVNGSHNIAVCEWDGDEWVALDPRMVDSRVDAAIKGQTPDSAPSGAGG